MKTSTRNVGQYQVETYHLKNDLSFSMAYEKYIGNMKANGGLRFSSYGNQEAQEKEALTLAMHMTEKHSIYNTGFSGVKLVANGENTQANKALLLESVAKVLNEKNGNIYTGCDMNISNEDMNYLNQFTPYILNSMSAPQINTSTATAWGVYGSLRAVMDIENPFQEQRKFLINGIGKIGSIIADKLISLGHIVFTFDVDQKKADITGAINISGNEYWAQINCDYMILCSSSNIITDNNVHDLKCRWIVSSANAPFANDEISQILKSKDIHWIPDVVSNAGAVICDAIEFKEPERYSKLEPVSMYSCVEKCIYSKTKELLDLSSKYHLTPSDALDVFLKMQKNEMNFAEAA